MSLIKKLFGKDEPASMTEQLQQLYMEVLKANDADIDARDIHLDDDGDVVFTIEDLGTFWLSVDEKDPEYFHLVYPNFLDHNRAQERYGADLSTLFRACNEVRIRCKSANVFLNWDSRDSTWNAFATIEAVIAAADTLPARELVAATLRRNIGAIVTAVRGLHEELGGEDEDDEDDDSDE